MKKSQLFAVSIKAAFVALALLVLMLDAGYSQRTEPGPVTEAERLRGSITPEREWWDVQHYDLSVRFMPETRSIMGANVITFKTLKPGSRMQIDLQMPLTITKVLHNGSELKFERVTEDGKPGNVFYVTFDKEIPQGVEDKVEIFYEGHPTEAKLPPWSGGVYWGRDDLGNWYINTTCEGIGASIWWPNKDIGSDEHDHGMNINLTVPDTLVAVSNGRLKGVDADATNKTKTFHWVVVNPINNYGVNANIGNYVNFTDKYQGLGGTLDLSYWVLPHQKEAAIKTFQEVPRMLKAYEYWFGKYPFYEDGYKLITVSYPGMEHQSSVTYGNYFRNGYRERDVSGTGVGYKFDFIIVHESAHEWWGNNISCRDGADMWIHEGFANYAEGIFTEYWFGEKDADDYIIGSRRNIGNDRPIIGTYGANREGSGDMYYKGGNLLHTIRQVINDDEKWRSILQGLQKTFWHQTVTTNQIESYITEHAGIDLSKVFDEYLRTTNIPVLQYKVEGNKVTFKYDKVVPGFAMPLKVNVNGKDVWIKPTEAMQEKTFDAPIANFAVDRNFLVNSAKMS